MYNNIDEEGKKRYKISNMVDYIAVGNETLIFLAVESNSHWFDRFYKDSYIVFWFISVCNFLILCPSYLYFGL